jgi:hypothetical protein
VQFFCRHQRKSLGKVETKLIAKTTQGTRTGTIRFAGTGINYMFEEIEVLLHACNLQKLRCPNRGGDADCGKMVEICLKNFCILVPA